ncbi:GntR family transcriptional regulator [Kribbella solani]|uniref:GntR family transcriptional regulator n=1 Tax=Kribbella solani TaxID=236067 RepID=UPI0029A0F1DE|nr:GntR family transcriptional regulator [Kribbella solani]MDX3003238.1 GntR family transcriptional regulator [Kribbella solani]
MQVETNDPRPPYAQVADALRDAIRSGELPAGTKLPAGRDLAKQWGIALMTARKALDQLRAEGLVFSQQGRGVFVAALDGHAPASDLTSLQRTVNDLARRLELVEEQLQTRGAERS